MAINQQAPQFQQKNPGQIQQPRLSDALVLEGYTGRQETRPSDILLFLRKGTLSGGSVKIDLDGVVGAGQVVKYQMFKEATMTVDTDGRYKITASNAAIGNSDTVTVAIMVEQHQLANAGNA